MGFARMGARGGFGFGGALGRASGPAPVLTIALSSVTIGDTAAVGDNIGTLSTSGGTGPYTYTLTSNPGTLFSISTATLKVAAALSVGADPITVQSTDSLGHTGTASFTIDVVTAANLRFAVSSGTGNISSTTMWSLTSNGAGSAGVPDATSYVVFDGASGAGAYVLDASQAWKGANFTGFTGTVTHNAAVTITVGATGSLGFKLASTMTYTLGSVTTSIIALAATNAVATPFTSGGKTLGLISQTVANSSWIYQDDITAQSITHQAGVFNANGKTFNLVTFTGNSNTAKTWSWTNAIFNISGTSGAVWNNTSSNSLTSTMAGSVINLTGNGNIQFIPGTLPTYNTVNGLGAGVYLFGTSANAGSYVNVSRIGTAVQTDGLRWSGSPTISGTFTATGNSLTKRLFVQAEVIGTTRTITAGAVALTNVDFISITGAGAATWSGTSVGDATGNSGITFTPSRTVYYVGDGLNWSNTASWALSSGGPSGVPVPLIQDTMLVDNNSFSILGQTLTLDTPRIGSLDMSGLTNEAKAPLLRSNQTYTSYGTVFYISKTMNPRVIQFAYDNSFAQTFGGVGVTTLYTPNGCYIGTSTTQNMSGGTLQFAANNDNDGTANQIVWHSSLIHTQGTMDINDNNILVQSAFSSTGALTRNIKMGAGTWLMVNSGAAWTISGSNVTVTPSTSTVALGATATQTFAGGGFTYANISINQGLTRYDGGGAQAKGAGVTVTGANTFTDVHEYAGSAAYTITWPASATQTIATLEALGSSGKLISNISSSAGTAATLSVASGVVNTDFLSLKDSAATGGAVFHAGLNSTNVSGNSGWIFP